MKHRFRKNAATWQCGDTEQLFYFLTDNPPRGKLTALHAGSEAVPLGMTPMGEDCATVDIQQLNLRTMHASSAVWVAENGEEVPAASVFTGKS